MPQFLMEIIKVSKTLSKILRHKPESIGITLTPDGWVDIDVLLKALADKGNRITRDQLMRVVAENDKKRFAVDGNRIRASQGHSVDVDLGYAPAEPPSVLYHGTAERNLSSILTEGLDKGSRHHVHLSASTETATRVGARHGKPVVLTVDTAAMMRDGALFYVSENGVWLTDSVPPEYLQPAV